MHAHMSLVQTKEDINQEGKYKSLQSFLKGAQFAHLEKFCLNLSSSSFVIHVNHLHP